MPPPGSRLWLVALGLCLSGPLAGAEPEVVIAACASKLRSYSELRLGSGGRSRLELKAASGGGLTYLGAVHSLDPGHRQFRTIEEAFDRVEPTIVFYEGHDGTLTSSRENAIRKFGESGLVRFLAAERGTPMARLEPAPREEIGQLVERFSPERVQLFFLLRDVTRLRDRERLPRDAIQKALEETLANPTPGLPSPLRDLDEVEQVFWRYWPYPSRWWEARTDWFNPFYPSERTGGVFTNDIARASGQIRDRYMYETLARTVLEGHTVLAVVGRDHLPMQASALRCALSRE